MTIENSLNFIIQDFWNIKKIKIWVENKNCVIFESVRWFVECVDFKKKVFFCEKRENRWTFAWVFDNLRKLLIKASRIKNLTLLFNFVWLLFNVVC